MTRRRMIVLEGPIPPDTDEIEYVDGSDKLLPEEERPTEADHELARWITEDVRQRRVAREMTGEVEPPPIGSILKGLKAG